MLVSLTAIAEVALIDVRRVRKAVQRIASGKASTWRGAKLVISVHHGRGGKSGKYYLVEDFSLPPLLQERLNALQTPVATRSNGVPREAATRQHLWWVEFLRDAVAHPQGSPELAVALATLADKQSFDWEGKPYTPRLRTLQRQAKRHYENQTAAHRSRADKGGKRTFVSRIWDNAVPFDDATKERIAEDLKQEIRGLLKGGAASGHARLLAARKLRTLTRAEGFRVNDTAYLDNICAIPKDLVTSELHYKKVHQFKTDRKAYEDAKPRIRRSIRGMRPMELVVADVHPVDVHLLRDDGSVATARFVAFMDWATQRVRGRLILLEKGGGIRNVDVIEAFADMAEDPSWGMPEGLYIDNGGEYNFADLLGDAMQLVVPGFHSPSRSCRIVRAMPYNAPAKPIERLFGEFEKRYLSALPGWIGGDRMKKRQEAVGRTVAPFGTFDAFVPAFYGMLGAYHAVPQEKTSALKGRSPNAVTTEHFEAGWSAVTMARDEVRAACARTEERQVKGGVVSVHGRTWTCRELQAWMSDSVLVRVPAYHEPLELLLLKPDGEPLGVALPDSEYHPLDVAGARDAAAQQAVHRKAMRSLDRSAPTVPVADRLIALGTEAIAPVANAPAGKISYGPTARGGVRAKADSEQEAVRREAERMALLENILNRKKAG